MHRVDSWRNGRSGLGSCVQRGHTWSTRAVQDLCESIAWHAGWSFYIFSSCNVTTTSCAKQHYSVDSRIKKWWATRRYCWKWNPKTGMLNFAPWSESLPHEPQLPELIEDIWPDGFALQMPWHRHSQEADFSSLLSAEGSVVNCPTCTPNMPYSLPRFERKPWMEWAGWISAARGGNSLKWRPWEWAVLWRILSLTWIGWICSLPDVSVLVACTDSGVSHFSQPVRSCLP